MTIRPFILSVLLLAVLLLLLAYRYSYDTGMGTMFPANKEPGSVIGGTGKCFDCEMLFTDNVRAHRLAYLTDGIAAQQTNEGLKKLYESGSLQELSSNEHFIVRELEFSQPYLLPRAASFVRNLTRRYYDKCMADGVSYIPFTTTSLTRTREAVTTLMEENINAIENSAHLGGKTFDIIRNNRCSLFRRFMR